MPPAMEFHDKLLLRYQRGLPQSGDMEALKMIFLIIYPQAKDMGPEFWLFFVKILVILYRIRCGQTIFIYIQLQLQLKANIFIRALLESVLR